MGAYKIDIVADTKKTLSKTVKADTDIGAAIKALTSAITSEWTISSKLTATTK